MLYRIAYSQRVINGLRTLGARATLRGLRGYFRDAVTKLDYLLAIYPQFGEPLIDLPFSSYTLWIGTVSPLVVRYGVSDVDKIVMVTIPIQVLRNVGLDP